MSSQGADFFRFYDSIVTDACLEPLVFFSKTLGYGDFANGEVLSASPAMLEGF